MMFSASAQMINRHIDRTLSSLERIATALERHVALQEAAQARVDEFVEHETAQLKTVFERVAEGETP